MLHCTYMATDAHAITDRNEDFTIICSAATAHYG